MQDKQEAYWDADNEFFNQYMAEQHIFVKCLQKLGKNIPCSCYKDCSPVAIEETEQYFTSNFIFINYKNFNLLPSKPNFFAKNELINHKTCYTQIEALKLYNLIQNDDISLPLLDFERLKINFFICCDLSARAFARFIFWFCPIRKLRKTYRPKLAEILYKLLTFFF